MGATQGNDPDIESEDDQSLTESLDRVTDSESPDPAGNCDVAIEDQTQGGRGRGLPLRLGAWLLPSPARSSPPSPQLIRLPATRMQLLTRTDWSPPWRRSGTAMTRSRTRAGRPACRSRS